MKKLLILLIIPFIGISQDISFEKYNNWLNPDDMSLKTIPVKDNIYMIEGIGGGVGNLGVLISNNGIVMIDNQFEILEDLLTAKVKELSDKPIKYIINTHLIFQFDTQSGFNCLKKTWCASVFTGFNT